MKNISVTAYDPAFSSEIAYATISLKDLAGLAPDSVLTAQSNLLTFVCSGNVTSPVGKDLMHVPDVTLSKSLSLSPAEIIQLTTNLHYTKIESDTLRFPFQNNASIRTIRIRSGTLKVFFSHYFQHHANIRIQIPMLTSGTVPVDHTESLHYSGTQPVNGEFDLDLSGYKADLSFGSGVPQNAMLCTISDSISYLGNPVLLNNHSDIRFELSNIQYDFLGGNFGSMGIGSSAVNFPLEFFKRVGGSGGITFENPKLEINSKNSFGFPVVQTFPQLFTSSSVNGNTNLVSSMISSGMNLIPTTDVTTFSQNVATLGTANSNLADALALSPSSMTVKQDDTPSTQASVNSYFMSDHSVCSTDFNLTLPLKGKFSSFMLIDTIPVKMDAFSHRTISGLRVFADNGFPVHVSIDCSMSDSLYNFSVPIFLGSSLDVNPASTDVNGNVTARSSGFKDFSISKDQYSNMRISNRLIAKISLTLPDSVVMLNEKSNVLIKIGASVKYR